jgi:hypothetical protein
MRSLIDQFKEVLKKECLNDEEKTHLKNLIKDFVHKRKVVARSPIGVEEESDCSPEWLRNNMG